MPCTLCALRDAPARPTAALACLSSVPAPVPQVCQVWRRLQRGAAGLAAAAARGVGGGGGAGCVLLPLVLPPEDLPPSLPLVELRPSSDGV